LLIKKKKILWKIYILANIANRYILIIIRWRLFIS
jgi:hypothetical protein